MENYINSLVRYLRLQEGMKLEYLARKLGVSKSHMSLLERNERILYADDFIKALKILNCEIKILKNGKDCVESMKKDVFKFHLTDVGYCKDYKDLNGNLIRVEFCTLDFLNVLVARDFKNTNEFLSREKYNLYEEIYSNDQR